MPQRVGTSPKHRTYLDLSKDLKAPTQLTINYSHYNHTNSADSSPETSHHRPRLSKQPYLQNQDQFADQKGFSRVADFQFEMKRLKISQDLAKLDRHCAWSDSQ